MNIVQFKVLTCKKITKTQTSADYSLTHLNWFV